MYLLKAKQGAEDPSKTKASQLLVAFYIALPTPPHLRPQTKYRRFLRTSEDFTMVKSL